MVYAYIRVSTQQQSKEGQEYEIREWCRSRSLTVDRWVTESISGTLSYEKRALGRALNRMKYGDILICTELSRLGRNMMMVMSILNLCSQKGISLYSIKDNFQLADNLNAKIIAFAFSLAAEIERNLISQRTREALAAKRLAGVRLGRPPGASAKKQRVLKDLPLVKVWLGQGKTQAQIARRYQIHPNTLARYLKETEKAAEMRPPALENQVDKDGNVDF